ncbi:uncharacterized protein TRIVIDRAFT_189365 [Trichoderma virens Gv29-8]|uniref:Uncharacterized protein n=1 Tax=Hypocrea virens (strain Gv29-8 / FGSC 10586) TaxID=413071 RepID=G9MJD4_HYPVG|nr:uncharacterized protein TRIVIDRAFT_189365 [Trichoderma virens Gv29-8]EHK25597.1 hypothetical protein TRIVIDRAFT_189365 [Trichoderma virens Gv29-8]
MVKSDRLPRNAFVKAARHLYNPIGSAKGYNTVLWFITCGALLGFSLAKLPAIGLRGQFCNLDQDTVGAAGPGECFHYLQPPACILPAGILACFQFVPVITILHRVNGYIVLLLTLVGMAGAFISTPVSYGGTVEIQTGIGVLSVAFLVCLAMAVINIKRLQIEQHRAWMIRAWVYAGSVITLRLIQILTAYIVSSLDTYYIPMPCDKLAFTVANDTVTRESYPECASFLSGQSTGQFASVRARLSGSANAAEAAAALSVRFGVGLWLAAFIHVIAVEIYLNLTPAEHERLREKNPGRAGLTVDRFGDAEIWAPKLVSKAIYNPLTPSSSQ